MLRRFAAQVRSLAPVGLGCLQESSESCSVDSRPKFGVLLRLAPAVFKKVRSLALVGARVADFGQISGAGEAESGQILGAGGDHRWTIAGPSEQKQTVP